MSNKKFLKFPGLEGSVNSASQVANAIRSIPDMPEVTDHIYKMTKEKSDQGKENERKFKRGELEIFTFKLKNRRRLIDGNIIGEYESKGSNAEVYSIGTRVGLRLFQEVLMIKLSKAGNYNIPHLVTYNGSPAIVRGVFGHWSVDIGPFSIKIPMMAFITDNARDHFNTGFFIDGTRWVVVYGLGYL